jgi:hypothetical protein
VQRVQVRNDRLAFLEHLAIFGFVVEVHISTRIQMRAKLAQKLRRPHRVHEDVVADDQVEAAVEWNVEMVVVNQPLRIEPVQLLQQKFLALPHRHH